MGNAESTSTHTQGTLDGNEVTFFYKTADEDGEESKISWTPGSTVYPDAKWTSLLTKDIIAVVPPQGGPASSDNTRFWILYVVNNPEKSTDNNTILSPKIFKQHEVTTPPGRLIHDFQPCPSTAVCLNLRFDPAPLQPNLHIIISTTSGTGLAQSIYTSLLRPFLSIPNLHEGKNYTLHTTTSPQSITDLTKTIVLPTANLGVTQSIILLSGDGGLLDIINALLASPRSKSYAKPNVALIPVGTGNALANSAGVCGDETYGIRNFVRGGVKPVPLFRARFSGGAREVVDEGRGERGLGVDSEGAPVAFGAVVCSWAFHAGLVADSDTVEFRKFGAQRFQMAAKSALWPEDGGEPHAYRGRMSVLRFGEDGGEMWESVERTEHMYVLATLVSTLEKGFTISPASVPLDGKMRLVHFGSMTAQEAMDVMTGAYEGGKHVEDGRVGYEQIDGLRIEMDEKDARWRRICIDGKIVRLEKGGWVEVRMAKESVVDLIVQ